MNVKLKKYSRYCYAFFLYLSASCPVIVVGGESSSCLILNTDIVSSIILKELLVQISAKPMWWIRELFKTINNDKYSLNISQFTQLNLNKTLYKTVKLQEVKSFLKCHINELLKASIALQLDVNKPSYISNVIKLAYFADALPQCVPIITYGKAELTKIFNNELLRVKFSKELLAILNLCKSDTNVRQVMNIFKVPYQSIQEYEKFLSSIFYYLVKFGLPLDYKIAGQTLLYHIIQSINLDALTQLLKAGRENKLSINFTNNPESIVLASDKMTPLEQAQDALKRAQDPWINIGNNIYDTVLLEQIVNVLKNYPYQ